MDVLCSRGPRPQQSSVDARALPRLNSKLNPIAAAFTAAFAALALLGAPAHAQSPDLASINVAAGLPANFTGATPLEVVTGKATLVGRLDPAQKLRVVIGLRPPHMAEEEAFLAELQQKGSPNFHKYLTAKEWNARFAPSAQDEQSVVEWARMNGLTVTQRYPNRLIVDVEGTADVMERAFAVRMNRYQVGPHVEFSNDRDPVVPSHLTGIIESVGGLNSIQRAHAQHEGNIHESPIYAPLSASPVQPSMHHDGNRAAYETALKAAEARRDVRRSPAPGLASDGTVSPNFTNGYMDPTDLYAAGAYDFAALQAQGHCCNPAHLSTGSPAETSIAIATAGYVNGSDITGFGAQYPYLAYNVNEVYVDGTPASANDESTLDTEWSMAMANSFGSYLDTSHVYVYAGVNNLISTFTDVYNAILNGNVTRVFSTSWGCSELGCWGSGNMNTDHAIFDQMIGQGWTLMAASGDQGADADCTSQLRVQYPASDPDVVGVGGTELALYSNDSFFSEVAWSGGTYSGACSSNGGGSTGGCSAYWAAPGYQSSPYCGSSSRSVPDVSLNAYYGQNYYFNGGLYGVGGTSIAAPEVAGFMAQENAYLDFIGIGCGSGYLNSCAPIGNANWTMYAEGYNSSYATHDPFYDITSGCNNNDVTTNWYCAGTGYDAVTGWGSFNALQLAFTLSSRSAGSLISPTVTFTGPPASPSSYTWYNTDQTIAWTVTAQDNPGGHYPAVGLAGTSWAWDNYVYDAASEPNQANAGSGDAFYAGPQIKNTSFTNTASGSSNLASAGQGCHFMTVWGEDNAGYTSGDNYYYWVCYDNVAPTITMSQSPNVYWAKGPVQVTLTPADASPGSGVAATYYAVNSFNCYPGNVGGCAAYSSPFNVTQEGQNYLYYWTKDNAGNVSAEPLGYVQIDLTAPASTIALNGNLVSGTTFKSKVQVVLGATDALSGVFHKYYQLDGGSTVTYTGSPFNVTTLGSHTVKYWAKDVAGNIETAHTATFTIVSATTTTFSASPNPQSLTLPVTLKATVTATYLGTPTGSVTFYNGSTSLGSATVNSSGVASMTTSSLPAGVLVLHAVYTPTGNFLTSTSPTFNETILKPAVLTTPTPGSTLAGSTVTFTWTAATGAVNYAFRIGTTVGGNDVYSSGLTTATSATPTTLPTNGSTLYVRLYTHFSTNQGYYDYVYTAK